MPRRTTIAPPISRVHYLVRLRTVVNDASKYEGKITSYDACEILVERGLSKRSILDSSNKQKRGRDHVHNASFLGYLTPHRERHGFVYDVSPYGELLSKYKFGDECPKDLCETAIHIDRLMRLKLTNPYDSERTYVDFKTRPLLSLLSVLHYTKLHISQVYHILGLTKDLVVYNDLKQDLLEKFKKYREYEENAIEEFMHDHDLDESYVKREISRSAKPLLDWCQQAGLVMKDKKDWYNITEQGEVALNIYSKLKPLWYEDLGMDAFTRSGILLFYAFAKKCDKTVDSSKLDGWIKIQLREMQSDFQLFDRRLSKLVIPIDFDLYYDVPIAAREQVMETMLHIAKKIGIDMLSYKQVAYKSIALLKTKLKQTGPEKRFAEVEKAFGITLPRREGFQTDFEWQTCIRLRFMGFPAYPYQGDFSEICDLRIAKENPDVLIRNGMRVLVECKEKDSWVDPYRRVRLGKSVIGEISSYQAYSEEIEANSTVFVCGASEFDEERYMKGFFRKYGRHLDKVVLSTFDYLEKIMHDKRGISKFKRIIKEPWNFDIRDRVLS